MAKLMIKAIGLFGLTIAYATGAWAACGTDTNPGADQLEVCVVGGPSYAMDLFGPGADDLTLGYELTEAVAPNTIAVPAVDCSPESTNGPKVVIELPMGAAEELDAAAEIVYTLHGALFADRVRNSDLGVKHHEDDAGFSFTSRVTDGGAVGDDFVAFEVEVEGLKYHDQWSNGCVPTAHPESKVLLAFEVPQLSGAGAALAGRPSAASPGVLVQVEVGFDEFGRVRGLPGT